MKKILLLGSDGYIGWALLQRLANKGYNVVCVDSGFREKTVRLEMESRSALPESSLSSKLEWISKYPNISWFEMDFFKEQTAFKELFKENKFDIIINLAHQPSGPYSQKNYCTSEFTLSNNILGTNRIMWLIKEFCPDAHYITIGSTGEYSHNLDIPIKDIVEYLDMKYVYSDERHGGEDCNFADTSFLEKYGFDVPSISKLYEFLNNLKK